MHEERDATDLETEARRHFRQVDLFDDLDLQEMISRAERTQLRRASFHCGLAHRVRIGTGEATAFLCTLEILSLAVAFVDRPASAPFENAAHLARRQAWDRTAGTHAGRDRRHKRTDDLGN